jgi:hypothetical protein
VDLYIRSPIRLHGVVLNSLITGKTLPFTLYSRSVVCASIFFNLNCFWLSDTVGLRDDTATHRPRACLEQQNSKRGFENLVQTGVNLVLRLPKFSFCSLKIIYFLMQSLASSSTFGRKRRPSGMVSSIEFVSNQLRATCKW